MSLAATHLIGFGSQRATVSGPTVSWNPSDKGTDITLSGGNLIAANGVAAFEAVRALSAVPAYKAYYEFTANSASLIIGFGKATATLASYVGSDANGWGWQTASGSKVYNAAGYNSYTGAGDVVANDIVMIAVDMAARKFWGGRNGTWHNSGNPGSGTGQATFGTALASSGLYLMASSNVASTFVTIRSTATYSVPSGFTFIAGG